MGGGHLAFAFTGTDGPGLQASARDARPQVERWLARGLETGDTAGTARRMFRCPCTNATVLRDRLRVARARLHPEGRGHARRTDSRRLLHPGIHQRGVVLRPLDGVVVRIGLVDHEGERHAGHQIGGQLDVAQHGGGFGMRLLQGRRVVHV